MARWTASAKWAAGPALDGQRDMPLALRLSEGLGLTASVLKGLMNLLFQAPCVAYRKCGRQCISILVPCCAKDAL